MRKVALCAVVAVAGALLIACPEPEPPAAGTRIIDHSNFDADLLGDAAITAAAGLKVYFEHASTGQDIVGNSSTDSSTGVNSFGTDPCGLALLYALDPRYSCSRSSYSGSNDATWFETHSGLQSNMRGNPPSSAKLSGFLGLSADMCTGVDVAFFKFCWIDVGEINYTDGAAFARTMIEGIEAFEAANAGLVVPYMTMPLQSNESYPEREAFNNAIRAYCAAHDKWLLDIADIECHDATGAKAVDGDGREIAVADYVVSDGGHLSEAGRLKMARAYWSLIAGIAAER